MFQIVQENVAVHGFFFQLYVLDANNHFGIYHNIVIIVIVALTWFYAENSIALRRQFREQAYCTVTH